jgi:hypothetical protein
VQWYSHRRILTLRVSWLCDVKFHPWRTRTARRSSEL